MGVSMETLLGPHRRHIQKKLTLKTGSSSRVDKSMTPSKALHSQFLFAADSTRVRRWENNDGTVKHEQKT